MANLLLARAAARQKEIAIRGALGASRGQLVRQLLVESLTLAVAGGVAGLLLSFWLARVLVRLLPFDPANMSLSAVPDTRVLLFTTGITLLTALFFGLVPALRGSRVSASVTLKEGTGSIGGSHEHVRLRKTFVALQVALSCLLLLGAGLFVRTLGSLRGQGPGFATTNLLSFRVDPTRIGYGQTQARKLMRDLLVAVRSLPEVESAGLSAAQLLGGGSWNTGLTVESERRFATDRSVHLNAISPGFFGSLGASFISGRDFEDRDSRDTNGGDDSFRSAIVNESFAKRYFGDTRPVGARLGMGTKQDTRADIEIIGVVKTFSYRGLRETDDQAFFPYFESAISAGGFYVRTRIQSESAFSSIRAAVRQVDPSLPVTGLRTLDDQLPTSSTGR